MMNRLCSLSLLLFSVFRIGIAMGDDSRSDPPEFSVPQRIVQASAASLTSVLITYPTYALKQDLQAGMPINFMPSRLYHGMGAILKRSVPVTTTSIVMNHFLSGGPDSSSSQQIFAGMVSGVFIATISNPFELLSTKQRLYLASETAVHSYISRNHGWIGYTQGMRATIARDMVYSIGLFVVPGAIHSALPESWQDSTVANLATAGTAGVLAGLVSLPLDAVRGEIQRMELQPGASDPGIMETFGKMYREGGTTKLFKGYQWRAGQIGLSFIVLRSVMTGIQDIQSEHYEKKESPSSKNQPVFPQPLFVNLLKIQSQSTPTTPRGGQAVMTLEERNHLLVGSGHPPRTISSSPSSPLFAKVNSPGSEISTKSLVPLHALARHSNSQ